MVNRLQALSKVPLLVRRRLRGWRRLPHRRRHAVPQGDGLRRHRRRAAGLQRGHDVRAETRALGVHLHFAPVADVNNNPKNPVINMRSYGADRALRRRLRVGLGARPRRRRRDRDAQALSRPRRHGHRHASRVRHGGASADAPRRSRARAVPQPRIAAEAGAVMTAHLGLSAVDDSGNPATLSKPVIDELLRASDLGFDGLSVTDSMGMAGVTSKAGHGEAAVRAVEAGNDIVLNSPDQAAAVQGPALRRSRTAVFRRRVSMRRSPVFCGRRRGSACLRSKLVAISDDIPEPGRHAQRAPGIRADGVGAASRHAGQGQAQSGPAEAAARGECAVPVDRRTTRLAGGSPRRAAPSSPSCASAGRTRRRSSCRPRHARGDRAGGRWRRATTRSSPPSTSAPRRPAAARACPSRSPIC